MWQLWFQISRLEPCVDRLLCSAALAASRAMTTMVRGEAYRQAEWALLDAHYLLLQRLVAAGDSGEAVGRRAEYLSSIVNRSTIPSNVDVLRLQTETCQLAVLAQPCSSRALYLLGNAQLALSDVLADGVSLAALLEDARKSFEASVALEGKPTSVATPIEVTGELRVLFGSGT